MNINIKYEIYEQCYKSDGLDKFSDGTKQDNDIIEPDSILQTKRESKRDADTNPKFERRMVVHRDGPGQQPDPRGHTDDPSRCQHQHSRSERHVLHGRGLIAPTGHFLQQRPEQPLPDQSRHPAAAKDRPVQ